MGPALLSDAGTMVAQRITVPPQITVKKAPTLPELLPSWYRSLRAANRSDRTIESYKLAADQLIVHLREQGLSLEVDTIEADQIRGFLEQVLATRASATARQRYASLGQLFRWLTDEEEIATDPMAKVRPPKVIEQPVPVLSDDQLRTLIGTCQGKTFEDRRDEAVIRVLADTGMRLGELVGLKIGDVDLDLEAAVILGKGRRLRSAPFGKATTKALDRYLRARRNHRSADLPWLWLGLRGRLGSTGVEQLVARRSRSAGLGRVHPHQLRHSAAHRWLAAGGSEGDLMRLMGWQSPQMLARYGASATDQRAHAAHRRLALGDDL